MWSKKPDMNNRLFKSAKNWAVELQIFKIIPESLKVKFSSLTIYKKQHWIYKKNLIVFLNFSFLWNCHTYVSLSQAGPRDIPIAIIQVPDEPDARAYKVHYTFFKTNTHDSRIFGYRNDYILTITK